MNTNDMPFYGESAYSDDDYLNYPDDACDEQLQLYWLEATRTSMEALAAAMDSVIRNAEAMRRESGHDDFIDDGLMEEFDALSRKVIALQTRHAELHA